MDLSNKKDSKTPAEIFALAEKNNIEIREFSKHDLNMLTDNKPHQGFVLRAQPLGFTKLTTLEPSTNYRFDRVVFSCSLFFILVTFISLVFAVAF